MPKLRASLLPLALAQALLAPPLRAQDCAPVKLSIKPGWMNSGAWLKTQTGSELLVVDALNKTVIRYDESGRARQLPQPIGSALTSLLPSMIYPLDNGGYIVQVDNRSLLTLDKRFIPESRRSIRQKDAGGETLEGTFLWHPVGGDIIAFGDLRGQRETDWSSAFVRFSPSVSGSLEKLREVRLSDPSRVLYRIGYPYVASIGSAGYILLMEPEGIRLMVSEKGHPLLEKRLSPNPFGDLPVLPPFRTVDDLPPLMREIERSSMPTGIYGSGGMLYIAFRRPSARRGTEWTLLQFDPESGKKTGSIVLPMRANHLTIIPGQQQWAFVQKGPVEGYNLENIDSVVFIPASYIERMALPPGCGATLPIRPSPR